MIWSFVFFWTLTSVLVRWRPQTKDFVHFFQNTIVLLGIQCCFSVSLMFPILVEHRLFLFDISGSEIILHDSLSFFPVSYWLFLCKICARLFLRFWSRTFFDFLVTFSHFNACFMSDLNCSRCLLLTQNRLWAVEEQRRCCSLVVRVLSCYPGGRGFKLYVGGVFAPIKMSKLHAKFKFPPAGRSRAIHPTLVGLCFDHVRTNSYW